MIDAHYFNALFALPLISVVVSFGVYYDLCAFVPVNEDLSILMILWAG